jgi:alpha-beta hydrolase superfamily lysophospholipase
MKVEKFILKGKMNLPLSSFRVMPEGALKGVVQIFHGMGEHKERYVPFAKFLAKNGFAVYSQDHRKHGNSLEKEEDLGMFDQNDLWDNVLGDCYVVSRHIKKEHPNVQITILGHSMGSVILREFLGRYDNVASGAIIMGTLPKTKKSQVQIPIFLASVINLFKKNNKSEFLAKLFNNNLNKEYEEPRTDFDWLSENEANVDKYVEDPKCGFPYTPFFYLQFLKAMKRVDSSDIIFEGKDIPLLFISGKKDPVGNFGEGVKQIRELYSGHGFLHLTLKLFDDMKHEILQEKDNKKVFEYILGWLKS